MADQTKLEQNEFEKKPEEFEVEELNEGELEGVAGGLERDVNNGCTVNNVAHC